MYIPIKGNKAIELQCVLRKIDRHMKQQEKMFYERFYEGVNRLTLTDIRRRELREESSMAWIGVKEKIYLDFINETYGLAYIMSLIS